MILGLACGGIAAKVTLYAVVTDSADSQHTALHLEVFFTTDTIANSGGDIQRKVLD